MLTSEDIDNDDIMLSNIHLDYCTHVNGLPMLLNFFPTFLKKSINTHKKFPHFHCPHILMHFNIILVYFAFSLCNDIIYIMQFVSMFVSWSLTHCLFISVIALHLGQCYLIKWFS